MKCCWDGRKLEAEPRGGVSAAPDESHLLLWGWGLWPGCPHGGQGRRRWRPVADQARPALQGQPAGHKTAARSASAPRLASTRQPMVRAPLFLYCQPELQPGAASRSNPPCWKKTWRPENLSLLGTAGDGSHGQPCMSQHRVCDGFGPRHSFQAAAVGFCQAVGMHLVALAASAVGPSVLASLGGHLSSKIATGPPARWYSSSVGALHLKNLNLRVV